ncbi:MAG: peptidylprolyl isomerase [Chloroflexota bacterium]
MTLRSRQGSSRSRSWDDRDRRNMLLNVGFGLAIIAALLMLVVAWGVSWYGDHLSAAATVNGQTITKDAYGKALAVNLWRADYQSRRLRTLLAAGHIRPTDQETRQALLDQRLQQASALTLGQLIDGTIQAELASKQGVTVSDADIDARIKQEATTDELRSSWVISVAPTLATGESVATQAEKDAAKAKADAALTDLKAGKDWVEVSKAVSGDAAKDTGGAIGFIDKNASLDTAFVDAVMAVAKDTPTDVIAGADGTYRIGKVTEIIAPVEDTTFLTQVTDAGISMDDFRAAIRRDSNRAKLSDAVIAQYLAPGPQRKVSEIFIQEGRSEAGPSAVRVRHILYSPNGDPNTASKVAETDPAWAAAKAKADATYTKLKADISQFDSIARAESDEGSAKTTGGKLPYFSTDDAIDASFAAAIFADGLQPGQLLEPVKSAFGWHVVQIQRYPPDADFAAGLKTDIDSGKTTFAVAARDASDDGSAAQGGDLGWIGKGQITETREQAIFAAPVGKVSDPLTVAGEGIYLFLVSAEENRAPDAAQKKIIEASAFSAWYSKQKATYKVTRDSNVTGSTSG